MSFWSESVKESNGRIHVSEEVFDWNSINIVMQIYDIIYVFLRCLAIGVGFLSPLPVPSGEV